jgi:hypothetical protein
MNESAPCESFCFRKSAATQPHGRRDIQATSPMSNCNLLVLRNAECTHIHLAAHFLSQKKKKKMEEEEAKQKRTFTCSVCHETGHKKGSKECEGPEDEVNKQPESQEIVSSPKRVFTCGMCGEKGHRKGSELCEKKGEKEGEKKGEEKKKRMKDDGEKEEEEEEKEEEEKEEEKDEEGKERKVKIIVLKKPKQSNKAEEQKVDKEKVKGKVTGKGKGKAQPKNKKREKVQEKGKEEEDEGEDDDELHTGDEEKEKGDDDDDEEEEEGEEKAPASVERVLLGDLVLCTDKKGNYVICPVEQVLKKKNLEFSLAERIPPPLNDSKEVFICDPEDGADEFAEPRFGYYACTVMFEHDDDCLVYVHAMDPHIAASYAWFKKDDLLPLRSFEKVMNIWEVGKEVDVCRWEWQDNRQPVWCPATISSVDDKDQGIYSVEYERPLRFMTEEQIPGEKLWRYGKSKEVASEDNVFFARLRPHLEVVEAKSPTKLKRGRGRPPKKKKKSKK